MIHLQESILILSSNERNKIILKNALQSLYEIVEASDVKLAFDKIYSQRINSIFADMSSNTNEYLDFIRIVKGQKRYVNLPVFVLTSENNEDLELKALSLGATDFFIDTVNPSVLLNRIKNEFERQKAVEDAKRDPLTGIYNRYGIESNIDLSILYSGGKHNMALCMIDIDNFKNVNDTYGHKFGDKALCCVVDCINETVRTNDFVGRLGGDELMVVLNNFKDDSNLRGIVDRMLFLIEKRAREELDIILTCSMGISILGLHGNNRNELYLNADEALYQAKKSGKNSWMIYNPVRQSAVLKSNGAISLKPSPSLPSFLNSYLDFVSESIYITDARTYDLIYINDNLCRYLDIGFNEYQGEKCYSVIFGKDKPCEFCSKNELKTDGIAASQCFEKSRSKYYSMNSRYFEWNERLYLVSIIKNITSAKHIEIAEKAKAEFAYEELRKKNKLFWIYNFKERYLSSFSGECGGYGKNILEFSAPESAVSNGYIREDCVARYNEMYEKIRNGEKETAGLFWIKNFNSKDYFCLKIKYKTIFDENNTPIMAVGLGEII